MILNLTKLAEEAGRDIMKYFRSGDWTVTAKGDHSPVTQADLSANTILMNGLKALTAEPVVSEENEPELNIIKESEAFWLIDPLDGTRDFVQGLESFVICIARIENNYPVLGLIHQPVTGRTWWAKRNEGAFGPTGLKLKHTNQRVALIAAGSRSMTSERMQMFYDRFSIQEVRRLGSALKFCMLAEGEIDLYPRFGPTSEWDTAAGQIIAEEAGCKILEIRSGARLKYGKPDFKNVGGFMASRADLDLITPLVEAGLIKR